MPHRSLVLGLTFGRPVGTVRTKPSWRKLLSIREQNVKKFPDWEPLPNGGRRYWLDVVGRNRWRARYVKEVDSQEVTVRFYREIYDETGNRVEVHHKYPEDLGHRKV